MKELLVKGFILVNKPVGISSFAAVKAIRRITLQKKVGHAGTLDPFASGLLVLGLGREFTRHLEDIQALSKTYHLRMVLGLSTNTLDSYGQIDSEYDISNQTVQTFNLTDIQKVANTFLGEQYQQPPPFSAKKVNGQRAYKLARQGKPIKLEPSKVEIYDINIEKIDFGTLPIVTLSVTCSKGTYVRSLVRDIGKQLGVPAYTKDLIRTKIGEYRLDDALELDELTQNEIEHHILSTADKSFQRR